MSNASSRRRTAEHAARSDIVCLISGFLAKDARATEELFNYYYTRIARMAAPMILRMGVHGLLDGEDVANDVLFWLSCAARDGRLSIAEVEDLDRIVHTMVVRAVLKARRNALRSKRGGHGFGRLSAMPVRSLGGVNVVDIDALADEPLDPHAAPEDIAVAKDEAMRIIRLLGDPNGEAIVRLRLDGHTIEEIARRTGLAVSSVERKLTRARALYRESQNAG